MTSYFIVEGFEEGNHDLDEAIEYYLDGQDDELPRTVEVTVWTLAETGAAPLTVDCVAWVADNRPGWLKIPGLHLHFEAPRRPDNNKGEINMFDNELTSQQAADRLGVSRPWLVKNLKPARMVGNQRRYQINDVDTFGVDARDWSPPPCWTCGSRDCEPGCCPGPSPDDDLMLTARDTPDLADHEAFAHSGLIPSEDV